MTIKVYTGLPSSGKTSNLINQLKKGKENNEEVYLFLSNESPILTSRKNVKNVRFMGCRNPNLNYKIDYVVSTSEAIEIMSSQKNISTFAFDEAHFFSS